MNSTIKRDVLSDGTTIARITLLRNSGDKLGYSQYWVGDIRLEYGTKSNGDTWGRYFSITDFGNYSYAWFSIGKTPFEKFVYEMASRDQDYFLGKLLMNHDEQEVFLMDASKENARERLIDAVRDGDVAPDEFPRVMNELDWCENEQMLNEWYNDNLDDDCGYESFVYGPSPRAQGYKKNVFPLLAELLEANRLTQGENHE